VATAPPGTYWVAPEGLLAGAYPGGADADATRRRLAALRQAGVALFVDLTEEGELMPYAPLLDGARHVRRPIPDFGTVSQDDYSVTLDLVDEALRSGHAAYVHCLGGLGRTGTVAGCWLVRHGLDDGDAVRRIGELRRGLPDARLASPQSAAQRAVIAGWRRGL
jgi:protein-tyrosine phosphatase